MLGFALRAGLFGAVIALPVAGRSTPDDEMVRKPQPAPLAVRFRDVQRAPLVGKVPPELQAAADHWLGSPPTTLAALKGKVVWLQFNF